MSFFKGYVITENKKCIEKFKDRTDFKTIEQVQSLPEYAGILAHDAILIDIDDEEQSEVLFKICESENVLCKILKSRSGMHFLFKNSKVDKCFTKTKLACGLRDIDIKSGFKNSYEVLKIDGKDREVLYDILEGEEYQELPKWLFPVNSSVDFFGMRDGDGRDSALYSYILTLNSAGFSKDESRECISIMNKYVLADPMSEEDIDRITRDEAFPKETFYKGKSFLHNNFAQFMKNNDHIKRINGVLHIYSDGVYTGGNREIESVMVQHLPMLKAAQRSEVLKYLEIICPSNSQVADAKYIAFRNGILDITTGELRQFSPEIVITNRIPWEYDPEAYSEITDKTLNKIACYDPAIRALLEESIGYSFYRRNEMSKAFFLTGEGSNGKSTFLDMLDNVVGESNKSSLGLEELDERFSIATLANKLVNTGDDISDEFLKGRAIANFKKLVSGNEVKAEFKGQDAFFMKPYTKFFFSANALPRTKSKGFGALMRRLIIIPFNAKFSKSDPDYDPYITWKLREEDSMKYLVRLGVEGLKRVLEYNAFSESEKVQNEIKEYELENNPILLFLQEKEDSDIVNQTTADVHRNYRMFCIENGFTEMTLANFSKELNKRRGIVVKRVRVNGKLTGLYMKG